MRGGLLILFVIYAASGERGGRWFNREAHTLTTTVLARKLVTEATPSSCVVVQTSLPPCRHIRAVPIQPTQPQRIIPTSAPTDGLKSVNNQGWKPLLRASQPIPTIPEIKSPTPPLKTATESGWGWDFFNFGARQVYVTKTITEMHTSKYMDPNTVVTFSVKGCRPSRLPFDLPECKPPQPVKSAPEVPDRGIVVVAPIQLVPVVDEVQPSKTVEMPSLMPEEEKKKEPENTKEESEVSSPA